MKSLYLCLVFVLAGFMACQSADDSNLLPDETHEVPVSVVVGDGLKTRAAPPDGGSNIGGADIEGTSQVDKVRIIAFKRLKGTTDSFKYDSANDMVLDCVVEKNQRVARGSLKKDSKYDYQVIAFGYNSIVDIANFSFNIELDSSTTLEDFNVIILKRQETINAVQNKGLLNSFKTEIVSRVETPELFYGYCHSGDGQQIINGTNDVSLTGILYRAVGKVNIQISGIHEGSNKFHKMFLFAETVNSVSNASDYDDFKTPNTPVGDTAWKLLHTYDLEEKAFTPANSATVEFSEYLLATTTRLKIRVHIYDAALIGGTHKITDYILKFTPVDDDVNATGIISPVSNEEALYIRRNKQYNIKGTYQDLIK